MDSAEIRSRFLRFFEEREHRVVPSASLILDDPTLLFVNAGMVPFKPYFLGEAPPPQPRATSVQKCVRTLDIDEVGKTTRHASFFQMAGNFSFGDYFKAQAIPFAWELLTGSTHDGGYGFDPERMWVTVYHDDDEAAEIWHREIGLPTERIQRRGMADNFWSMGVPGPCGPASEIYYDRGPAYGREGGPVVDEDRYLEVWNLVFMQFERGDGPAKEDYPILGELPKKNIDTGMGLERMAALLQGVENIYEIDTTKRILDEASQIAGKAYGAERRDDVSLRVVADHTRTCAFLLGDGVVPGNEGRGYVLRRLLRRVIRNMRILGAHEPAMEPLIAATIDSMGPQYPELVRDAGRITTAAVNEEATFLQTLRTGTQIFDVAVADIRRTGRRELPGDKAFQLHDTYGFPIDLTLEMAAEQGLDVDEPGFRRLMDEQRQRAKADAKSRKAGVTPLTSYRSVIERAGLTEFTGYTEAVSESTLVGLLQDGEVVQGAEPGQDVEIILDRTPFYAEGGGQLGDHGTIRLADGGVAEVYDVQSPVPGLFVHRATVTHGAVMTGAPAEGIVDVPRREAISRAHTATHMIHRAFRQLLGETATQMGSENAPGRLRFDFPSNGPVPPSLLADAEALVNEVLAEDLGVSARVMKQDEAIAMGAMALFGEKYGEDVRVVSVGDWAHELCGGTHARRSTQLGLVKFLSESSIGAGVRRVEALVGTDAYRFLAREHLIVNQLTELTKSRPEELPDRIEQFMVRMKNAERELQQLKSSQLLARADDFLGSGEEIGAFRLWTIRAPDGTDAKQLRELLNKAKSKADTDFPVCVIGSAVTGDRVSMVAAVNERAVAAGVTARDLLTAAMPAVDGRGGGKDLLAQGGGSRPAGVPDAMRAVSELLRARVS